MEAGLHQPFIFPPVTDELLNEVVRSNGRCDFDLWPDQKTTRMSVELAERVTAAIFSLIPPEAKP
jgi:hypothetical protein